MHSRKSNENRSNLLTDTKTLYHALLQRAECTPLISTPSALTLSSLSIFRNDFRDCFGFANMSAERKHDVGNQAFSDMQLSYSALRHSFFHCFDLSISREFKNNCNYTDQQLASSYHHNAFKGLPSFNLQYLGHLIYGYILLLLMNQRAPNKLLRERNITC